MGRRIWNVLQYDKNAASLLALKCGADDFAVLLLQARGMKTAEEISDFLSSESKEISSPFLLKDMEKAVERINRAVDNGEKIHVFGDYDADGVTATALLVSYLETIGADVSCSIPSRLHEGYGLSPEAAERIVAMGVQLVITVDNGIASFVEADIFRSRGIDFIITDHHTVGETIPDAYAVIDPHREDDNSPEENLAGVGVALKLIAALEGGDYDLVIEDYGDLAAIGTIADIVPLTGENRIIVSRGLRSIERSFRPGIVSLIEKAGLRNGVNASSVAFGIAPKINAAGRIDNAQTALKLLMTEDFDEAESLVEKIAEANTERQSVEALICEEIEKYFDKNPAFRLDRVLVAAGENWHPGVIGIAASRLVEKYGRPAIVISVDEDGMARGSCRSIDGLGLYDALSYCSDCLVQFGGHKLAAGFSVLRENIDEFRRKINEYAASVPAFFPSMNIDLRLNPKGLCVEMLDSLAMLEPCGAGNPSPVFGLFGMTVSGVRSIGGDKHMKLTLTKDGDSVSAVYFGQSVTSFPYVQGDVVDVACKIEKNEYRGEIRLSIQIKDIRPAGENDVELFSSMGIYENFLRNEPLSDEERRILCPDRALLGDVYRFIREKKEWKHSTEILCMRLGIEEKKAGAVKICLDVLADVGILVEKDNVYTLTNFQGKADLGSCHILKKLGYN